MPAAAVSDDPAARPVDVLRTMNVLLRQRDDQLTAGFGKPDRPVIFVLAPPRGASTLFQQLTRSSLGVGCVSNIMARFWMAPYIGATLEQDMDDPNFVSSLKSYGRHYNPVNAHEPHEWGWFWAHWLRLSPGQLYCPPGQRIDGDGLNQKLAALQAVKQAPLLFDNPYAMCNIALLAKSIPQVLLVRMRRAPYYLANSVLNARIDRLGDVSAFFGHRPRDVARILAIDDPVEQAVAQIHAIMGEIEQVVANMGSSTVFTIDYPDIVRNPHAVMRRFSQFLAGHNCAVPMREPMPTFPQLRDRNHPKFVHPAHAERLRRCVAEYFGQDHVPT